MRNYTYRDGFAMRDIGVEADYVTFESGHVVFWVRSVYDRDPDHVVRAIDNRNVSWLREDLSSVTT